jgi:hypothetical protein
MPRHLKKENGLSSKGLPGLHGRRIVQQWMRIKATSLVLHELPGSCTVCTKPDIAVDCGKI